MAQQSQKFELPSGATLAVTVAPFADAWALMKASLKTLKGAEFRAEDLQRDLSDLAGSPAAIMMILDRIVDFSTSSEVEAAVWQCAKRALYVPAGSDVAFPGSPVDSKLFDDPDHGISAREDYAKIVAGIMEVNCKPFLARALSAFAKPAKVESTGSPTSR